VEKGGKDEEAKVLRDEEEGGRASSGSDESKVVLGSVEEVVASEVVEDDPFEDLGRERFDHLRATRRERKEEGKEEVSLDVSAFSFLSLVSSDQQVK